MAPNAEFAPRCNTEMVTLEPVPEGSDAEEELRSLVEHHLRNTGSDVAAAVLEEWDGAAGRRAFVTVM